MTTGHIAIIGGTGFERLPPEIFAETIDLTTAYGDAKVLSISDNYTEPYRLYFLPRHGSDHGIAPHQINYRANILALQQLEVSYVYASNAVGSLRTDLAPGSFVLFDDFIDTTRARPITLYGEGEEWQHTDFSVPYSPLLRESVLSAAARMKLTVISTATYVCCDGPRFESPAEIRMYASWGGDVVGMTGLPEATMAREAGMEYAGLGIVTNYGAGLTVEAVQHSKVTEMMGARLPEVRELLLNSAGLLVESRDQSSGIRI